jgi:hypothetical protein
MGGKIYAQAMKSGFRSYNFKLLTLTFGGKDRRAKATPEEAAREMSEGCTKLLKEIRHLYGKFDYIKVFETHKDGWPHLHILLCGDAIAPKEVLDDITRLWRFRYGFGFVKLNWASSPDLAIRYILKYLFKCPAQIPKIRIFSNSQEALERVAAKVNKQWESMKIMWGGSVKYLVESDEDYYEEHELMPVRGCPF